ncbi:MAG: hypothetical protein M0C28_32220 [Candidatus Moduliflexus flocculans]|nr:hypothetical protein [Candidatus Moduliflexus flocculans]
MLQQIMTATGVRGLVSFAVISTPLVLLFFLLPVIIPFSEGILTYGAAAIIGIPLIWYPGFDRLPRDGRHRRAEPALAPRRRTAADGPDRPAQQHGLRLQGHLPGFPQGHLAALAGHHRRGHGHDRLQLEAGLPGQVEHVGMRGTLR